MAEVVMIKEEILIQANVFHQRMVVIVVDAVDIMDAMIAAQLEGKLVTNVVVVK